MFLKNKSSTDYASSEAEKGFSSYLQETSTPEANRQIGFWLLAVSALLVGLVLVGGLTRLTDSGLSIVEWKPVTGMIPPLSEAAWQEEFQKYQTIPEYEEVNFGMSLDEFKTIFWWEWGHRFIARMLGFAFFIPFVWFVLKRKVSRELFPKLSIMFVLGGAQGALGWFMVMSGLSERVDVSQYRLVAHLGLAFFILAYMVWVACDLLLEKTKQGGAELKSLINFSLVMVVLVYLQVLLGGFVAGIHAGLTYNTWPLMDGGLVPTGYWFMTPWYVNFFENHAAVQFNHRMVAYLLTAGAIWVFLKTREKDQLSRDVQKGRHALLGSVLLQVVLGIWTLLAVVPIWLGALHQAGAIAAFLASLYYAQALRKMA